MNILSWAQRFPGRKLKAAGVSYEPSIKMYYNQEMSRVQYWQREGRQART